MKKKWLKIFGLFLLIKGIVLIFLVYRGITGYSIADEINTTFNSAISLVLIVVGILIVMLTKEK